MFNRGIAPVERCLGDRLNVVLGRGEDQVGWCNINDAQSYWPALRQPLKFNGEEWHHDDGDEASSGAAAPW
jgi:hypothetical protein